MERIIYGALLLGRGSRARALLDKVLGGTVRTMRNGDEALARLTRRASGSLGGTASPRAIGYAVVLLGALLTGAVGFLLGRRFTPNRGRITSGDAGQGLPAGTEETSLASREGGEETPMPSTEEAPAPRYEVPGGPEEVCVLSSV